MKTCLLLAVFVAASAVAEESPFKIHCQSAGRNFICVAIGAEDLRVYPRWILHTNPRFEAFIAPEFEFVGRAPKRWTYITANFYNYDTGAEVQACMEVALIDGKALFREPCRKPSK